MKSARGRGAEPTPRLSLRSSHPAEEIPAGRGPRFHRNRTELRGRVEWGYEVIRLIKILMTSLQRPVEMGGLQSLGSA